MKPMLAAASNGEELTYPVLVSPKLDGVRAIIIDGVVMSRSLKPIPNKYVQSLFGNNRLNGFDGELIVGPPTAKDVFQKTQSSVMKHDGNPPAHFCVFDNFHDSSMFNHRHKSLCAAVKNLPRNISNNVSIVPHHMVNDVHELVKFESEFLKDGYEGLMVRSVDGPYKHGRSTVREGYLLKVKRFEDSEAVITGMSPLMHNNNEQIKNELGHSVRSSKKEGKVKTNMLGSLKVRDITTGVEFEIGTGFTEMDRIEFYATGKSMIGRVIKYKSQKVGVKDKPRFPVFLGFRNLIDL